MVGQYEIKQGGQPIGKAEVTRQGLYFRISCRCALSGTVICKVRAVWKDRTEDLGVLVPEGSRFVLSTCLPVKRTGQGIPEFQVLPKHEPMDEHFVPVCADEPFAYLSRLENAYLASSQGKIGLLIREDPE